MITRPKAPSSQDVSPAPTTRQRRRLILSAGTCAVMLAATPFLPHAGSLAQTGGDGSTRKSLIDIIEAAKKGKSAATKGCTADAQMAFTWLNDSRSGVPGPMWRLKGEIEAFIAKWDDFVPASRFLAETAGQDAAGQAARKAASKRAQDKFKEFSGRLLDLAQDAAIAGSRDCQDCLLLNDWAYLGAISYPGNGAERFGLSKQTQGFLVQDVVNDLDQVVGRVEFKLEDATRAGVREAQDEIQQFQAIRPKYDGALEDTALAELATLHCSNVTTLTCISSLRRLCEQNAYGPSPEGQQFCIKSFVSQGMRNLLVRIVETLRAHRSDVKMSTLNSKACVPGAGTNAFRHLKSIDWTKPSAGSAL